MEDIWKNFEKACEKIGINKNDILYVVSDLTMLFRVIVEKYDIRSKQDQFHILDKLTNILLDIVGEHGTVLFPVFSWRFCRGESFDIRTTPGEVGAWGNWILKNRDDFVRTRHPIYSFMVHGQESRFLANLNNINSFGANSPFAYLHNNGGKILNFNIHLPRGFTFLHYIEETIKAPYRYSKSFRSQYIDKNGMSKQCTYNMYVRDLSIQSEVCLSDDFLENAGGMRSVSWDGLNLNAINLKLAYTIIVDDLLHNHGNNCYRFDNYVLDWSKSDNYADELDLN